MMHTTLKHHTSTLIVTAILFIAGAIGFWRFTDLMDDKKTAVITAKEQLAAYEASKQIFTEESKALAQITERVSVLEQYRVTSATTPELLSSLEDLAGMHGVDFAITTVTTPGTGQSQKLLIDVSGKGSRESIDAFLKALLHQPYQLKFTKLSLFADEGSTVAGQWSVLASIQIMSF